jgi:hypothetical protein
MCDFPKQLNIIHENSKTIEFNYHDSIIGSKKRPNKAFINQVDWIKYTFNSLFIKPLTVSLSVNSEIVE